VHLVDRRLFKTKRLLRCDLRLFHVTSI
jgi:hypothetical protein